jgi:phytoene synthase
MAHVITHLTPGSECNPSKRRSVWAIYSWCRILDETVDSVEAAEAGSNVAAAKLTRIESQLKRIFSPSSSDDDAASPSASSEDAQTTLALADTIRTTPGMSAESFLDMIAGMRSDLSIDPDAEADVSTSASDADVAVRFKDWPELRRYCYNVAGTVGLMTLPVMGVAEGYSVEDATPAGVDLGGGCTN